MSERDFPRDPSEYRPDPSGHFRRKRKERKVPGPAIRECIENGEPEIRDGHDGFRLVATWSGVCYWVVIRPEKGLVVSCGTCGN
jgi:hypothetical protein